MNKLAEDTNRVEVYPNDVTVLVLDEATHDVRTLKLFDDKNIVANPKKCSFFTTTFEFLDYLVDDNGFEPGL